MPTLEPAPRIGLTGRIAARARPFFAGWLNGPITIACALFAAWVAVRAYGWAWAGAVFHGDAASCRAATGACWAFVIDKFDFAVFGFFPQEARWRAVIAVLLIAATVGGSLDRRSWRPWLAVVWCSSFAVAAILLRGGVFGLSPAPLRTWSGLVLTVWIAVLALATSYPLGLVLALGRRSDMRVIRWMSTVWIEVVRGVPLISILFLASIMVPLFLPEGVEIDGLVRAEVGFTIFGSAYLAEVFRAGLQTVPESQREGALSIGLTASQTMRLVVIPQALKAVIPAQVNTFIMIFKDTSLVLIIGIFDLLGTLKASLSDPAWLGFSTEIYVAAAAFYFVICYGMSRFSRHLERTLSGASLP